MRGYFARGVCGALVALSIVGSAAAQSLSPTRTRLISHSYPSAAGASVTLRAEVDGLGAGAPSRPFMTFYDGPTRLGVSRVTVPGAGQETIAIGTYDLGSSCAVTSVGGVKCWGYNDLGQLGDGTDLLSRTPVDVVGLTSGVVAVTVGSGHACALTSVGGVKCWGNNSYGQLGNGRRTNSRVPVDVAGMKQGILAVSAGGEHTCAFTRVGGVRCWGKNASGELGDGGSNHTPSTYSPWPINVSGLSSHVNLKFVA